MTRRPAIGSNGRMNKLSINDIEKRLQDLEGWSVEDGALVKTYLFPSFPDAIAFVGRLAFDAEASDHHPDMRISYKRVTVAWSTHSEGGVTDKDFAGARQSDTIAAR